MFSRDACHMTSTQQDSTEAVYILFTLLPPPPPPIVVGMLTCFTYTDCIAADQLFSFQVIQSNWEFTKQIDSGYY